MRPMFFEYPDDAYCYELDDQYLFGSDILFAPIYQYGQTSRTVYLPEGVWVRTNDKTEYNGRSTVTCAASKKEFIAFVRKGADVLQVF